MEQVLNVALNSNVVGIFVPVSVFITISAFLYSRQMTAKDCNIFRLILGILLVTDGMLTAQLVITGTYQSVAQFALYASAILIILGTLLALISVATLIQPTKK